MKILFLFLLFSSSYCCGNSTNWLSNIFSWKQYKGTKAYHQKDYDEALELFHDLMNKDPYNPVYNYNVGDILYRQKKYHEARQAFAHTIAHARKTSKLAEQAYFNSGNCSYQLQEWNKAVDAYEQTLKIDDANEQAKHNLQLALYKLKEQQMKDQSQQGEEKSQQDKNEKLFDQMKDKNEDEIARDDKNQSDGNGSDNQFQDANQNDATEKSEESSEQKQSNSQKSKKNQQQKGENQEVQEDSLQQDSQKSPDQENGKSSMDTLDDAQDSQESSSYNQSQASDTEKKDADEMMKELDQTQGAAEEIQTGSEDMGSDDKKEMGGSYKKRELKNQLQDQYEGKASDDERLNDYHASVMKTLEDLEEKIQKHVIKNKVAMQGSEQNGKKCW
ncbi:MAG: tetratricopeptide repeat protein [Candidatus Dependentiae bacterium]|nr:tetratricopeptide repeat protein [Candidatus Dependentiae bacterium]